MKSWWTCYDKSYCSCTSGDDIADAIALLTQALKFSAYVRTENKPPRLQAKGEDSVETLSGKLKTARSVYANMVDVETNDLNNRV